MGSIFSLSDTIDFGDTSKKSSHSSKPKRSHGAQWWADHTDDHVHSNHHSAYTSRSAGSDTTLRMEPTHSSEALIDLISSMKPSFLPKDDSGTLTRQIILSSAHTADPSILLARDDMAILIGTGEGQISAIGKHYTSFPDMRLPFSVASKLRAWILLEDTINVMLFTTLLPGLGFPPIYASRKLITFLRESIKDTDFLEKCRFFELFSTGSNTRQIGGFECGVASAGDRSVFAVRIGKTIIAYDHAPLELAPSFTQALYVSRETGEWSIQDITLTPGAILEIRHEGIQRSDFQFSLDTFYLDGTSIGIEAWFALADRKVLAENGVLFFTLTEDARARTISGHIFIDSRGFVHSYEMMRVHKEILKAIRLNYETIVSANPSIERGELAQTLRKEIAKYCFVLTGRNPIVMPIIL